jgi:membrane protease YdiL (CAAX protease family)
MMDKSLNTKRILIFLGFSFGIPWAAALAIALTGVWDNDPIKAVAQANLVFISSPVVANIFTRLLTKEGWGHFMLRPNFRQGRRFWLAAWLLPLLAAVVGGAIFYLFFPQSLDPDLGEVRKLTASIPSAATVNPWLILISIALQSVLIAVPINAVASLGEEFGWRAYLLPKLLERFAGAEPARVSVEGSAPSAPASHPNMAATRWMALLVGLIHGVWHWPLFFLSTRFDPGSAFPFPLIYLLFTCSLSVLLSWATLRSGSVWPAAIGHGAVNATSPLAGYLLRGPASPMIGPAPTGLIGGLGYLILALVLLFSSATFTQWTSRRDETASPSLVSR